MVVTVLSVAVLAYSSIGQAQRTSRRKHWGNATLAAGRHHLGGWKCPASASQPTPAGFGPLHSECKTVISRWPSGVKEGAEFVIPAMN